ncbi:flavin reductase family protein [Primorskyibacter sp. S187A]|uniref:flavin reductase family protein n=1 Tax=Primorskyibacter sp. S187A TaxID=3415130 RepID=UPI003C7C2C3E
MTRPTRFSPDDTRSFRDALGQFATGVTVITTHTDAGPVGMTCNSFASVSLEPALVLWSVAKSASRHSVFAPAERFAINVLNAEQGSLARTFAKDGQAFTPENSYLSEGGALMLRGAVSIFECSKASVIDGGDHSIVLGKVEHVTLGAGAPLVFHHGKFGSFLGS